MGEVSQHIMCSQFLNFAVICYFVGFHTDKSNLLCTWYVLCGFVLALFN